MFASRFIPLSLLALGLTVLPACDSDDPGDGPDPGDQELITNVVVTLTPVGGGDPIDLEAVDDNGDGVGVVYQPSQPLAAGTTYNGTIRLLDERNDVNITNEIEDEADEHLFAYSSSVSGVTVTLTDSESDYLDADQGLEDYAVGLRFRVDVVATASGTGTFGVTLYHFDDEPKTSSTDTSDDTDVELAFPISVQ